MTRSQKVVTLAFGVWALFVRDASAQATIEPASPRWGESLTITVEPNRGANEDQRLDPGDQVYAVLNLIQKGPMPPFERTWTPMKWDGRRFVARMTLPSGCELASVRAFTAERSIDGTSTHFICRTSEGTIPPGGLLAALTWGERDKANWKAEVAEDLAAVRATADHGWEYARLWTFRIVNERGTFTKEELLKDVQRVEREETLRTPGLLFSLFRGYDLAGQPATAFERLKEICDRYPESEFTTRDALHLGTATIVNHPELSPQLGQLLAQVAARAPQNRGLRELLSRLITNVPAVPLSTIRQIATGWMRDHPDQMAPHYLLAAALSRDPVVPDQQREADALVSKAIDLSLQPHPLDFTEWSFRQKAFELRSRFRAAHGDLAGAVADARMAQLVARDKAGAEDLSMEAGLWQRMGYDRRAEGLALDAFRLGSLQAEGLLKTMYVGRTGGDSGFGDYLIARLRERNASSGPALRPTPAFSATTLDGAKVDAASLAGRVTVLDFWFIGCPPCRAERPKLNDIVAEFGDKVRFVGFALDSTAALTKYIAETPFKYEIVPDSEGISKAFGVDSFPRHMVIDRAGRIVWMSAGDDDRIERLRAMIVRVLASDAK
jgi:thiol-disulfide isomerase/thioredoxin